MIKRTKISNYKKRRLVLIGSFTTLLLLGSSLGVFSYLFVSKKSASANTTQEQRVILPKVSSLSSYWNNLKTANLVSGKTSINNFVNENGAIFQNLIASKKYEATAALNQVVSTPKQIKLNSNEQTKEKLKEFYKESVRKDANAYYDYINEPIQNADEFIAKINLLKQTYPGFHENFVRARGQNYGIWVNKNYKSPKSFNEALPKIGENDERYINYLYLKANYRDLIINQNEGAYAQTLNNMLLVSSAQQLASLAKTSAPPEGGPDWYYSTSIKENIKFINAKYLASIFLYGNKKEDAWSYANSLFKEGIIQNKRHYKRKHDYLSMLACWFVCFPALVLYTPKDLNFQQGGDLDKKWIDTSEFNLDKIIHYGSYPIMSKPSESGLSQIKDTVPLIPNGPYHTNDLKLKDKINSWLNSLKDIANDNADNSWSWTNKATWDNARISKEDVSYRQKRQHGLKQAKADLEYLSNVYFHKIVDEWNKQIKIVKNGNDKIYFNGVFSTGKNSTLDLMRNEMKYTLFNPAMADYWSILTKQLTSEIVKYGSYIRKLVRGNVNTIRLQYTLGPSLVKKVWKDSFGNEQYTWVQQDVLSTSLNDLHKYVNNLYDKIKHILSEKNRKRIFKESIDKVWNKNKTTYENLIHTKLMEGKKDADVEFQKVKVVLDDYLKDAYNDKNFVIRNPVKDQLNQESIPATVGGKTTNFAMIPIGNTPTSPTGFDKMAQDILDGYLTKNVVLSSLLEKKSGVGSILSQKSIVVQQEYVNSLFATLRRGMYNYLKPILNTFETQNHNLWKEYLLALKNGSDKNLSPAEVEKYKFEVLYQKSVLHSKLLNIKIKSIKLAKGFLLDVLDISKFNDESKKYRTLFEIIDDSEQLQQYIHSTSISLLNQ